MKSLKLNPKIEPRWTHKDNFILTKNNNYVKVWKATLKEVKIVKEISVYGKIWDISISPND